MYNWFFLLFVVALFSSHINASHVSTRDGLNNVGHKVRASTELPYECSCQSARNEYTYKNPIVARLNIDPVYHYLNNVNGTWNCLLCDKTRSPIYHVNSTCQCDAAIQRYASDYNVTSNQFEHYMNQSSNGSNIWHCEQCLIDNNLTCVEARLNYSALYAAELGLMDEVFHYITYGYWQMKTWPSQACSLNPTFPTAFNCTVTRNLYTSYHNDTWGLTPMAHYLKYHKMIGWRWAYSCADSGSSNQKVPFNCECFDSKMVYWTTYPDAYSVDQDPTFHYNERAMYEPFRIWNCDLCYTVNNPDALSTSDPRCDCQAASDVYRAALQRRGLISTVPPPFLNNLFPFWTATHLLNGVPWHCELCINSTTTLLLNNKPKHLVEQTTCIAARKRYLINYPLVKLAGYDPVWHYENYGYDQKYFWDQTECNVGYDPKYLTSPQCANCEAAKKAYAARYPVASLFNDSYEHWRGYYLIQMRADGGYIFPCEEYCNLTVPDTTTTFFVDGSTTTTTSTSTTTTSSPTTTTTTTSTSTSTPTESPTSSAPTSIPTSDPTTTTSTTSTTTASPTGFSTTTTGDMNQNSSSDDGGGLNTTAVLAIVVPIAAVLSVGIGMLFIHQQRRQAVQALIKAEEGERRNYKIDFLSLSIDWLIGSGSFGYVYRGEYRGADVAIKKLKKQNMGNQQLEDFAKEAMVMVGLRHPNIVLFMGVCLERPELCIVTEYMPRGNLYDLLHDSTIKLPFNVIRNMAIHIVKGLQFIHSAGMIHRDLKSPNLLVDANWTIKIADFGLSCAKSQITDDAQISLLWTAPEILMREKNCYGEKSDVYSLGIILWELMSRQTPFNEYTAAAIPPVIVLGKRPPVNGDWNPTMKVLMAQCWSQLPHQRPTVREVRTTLESINIQDISISEGGINTPAASIHSSVSSEMGSELSVFPPRGTVTVVFMDVDKSASLWEADPSTMLVALKLFNEISRKLLIECGGYEAKTEGDASMLTFSDAVNAVNYCLATQLALLQAEWPEALLKHAAAKEEWSDQNVCLYRGIRVRMGLHSGIPHCEQDQITFRTEYFGPVVNTAARIVSQAVGGQIVASVDVYKLVANNLSKLEPCVVEQVGSCAVKGAEPIPLYQIWPKALKGRDIQPMLDLTNNNNNNNNNNSNNNNYTNLSNSRSVQYSASGSQSHRSNSLMPSPSHTHSLVSMDDHEYLDDDDDDRYAWNARHNEKWIINYDDLELDVVIGTGSFGDVFAGLWNGQKVAVKQFMKQKVTDEVLLEMRTESGILSAIEHPNIIRFLGMCIKIPHLCIVTELLERGSLSAILLGNEQLSWAQRKNFAIDIARGLEYLHSNNIIHRDVKSPNMLVAEDWTIKIGDFGFSRVKSESNTMTQCGTVAWTAPEIFLGERYSEKADVYSYAVILWELVFRKKPWQGMNSMKVCHAVERGERLPINNPPSGTPDYIIKLMEACWMQNHETRPSFTEVLKFLEQQR